MIQAAGKKLVTGSILDQYVVAAPGPQNAIDIFAGEWRSQLPYPLDGVVAGNVPLFEDERIRWANERIGGFDGMSALELGPHEGGHTFMLQQFGASSITAIEANTRAYLKCLIVKELLHLDRARFLCGDIIEYLRSSSERFDVVLACGVLYHMSNPAELLDLVARVSDRVLLSTLYYDEKALVRSPHIARRISAGTPAEWGGFRYTQYRYEYREALLVEGFCGGAHPFSHWLGRDDILGALRHFGLGNIEVYADQPDGPDGPALTILAGRSSPR